MAPFKKADFFDIDRYHILHVSSGFSENQEFVPEDRIGTERIS